MFSVSVVIPVFNASKTLKNAVDSAVSHDVVDEILLIEDGSNDDSLSVCYSLRDKYPGKVKVFTHKFNRNLGAGESRNIGLRNAKSNYIAFLDADDIFCDNRFECEILHYSQFGDFDGMYGLLGVRFLDNQARENHFLFNRPMYTGVISKIEPDQSYKKLILENNFGYFHLNALTINRLRLKEKNLEFCELRLHQDTVFIHEILFKLKIQSGSLSENVAIRGVHNNNRITNIKDVDLTRFLLYYELTKRIISYQSTKKYTMKAIEYYVRLDVLRKATNLLKISIVVFQRLRVVLKRKLILVADENRTN